MLLNSLYIKDIVLFIECNNEFFFALRAIAQRYIGVATLLKEKFPGDPHLFIIISLSFVEFCMIQEHFFQQIRVVFLI